MESILIRTKDVVALKVGEKLMMYKPLEDLRDSWEYRDGTIVVHVICFDFFE